MNILMWVVVAVGALVATLIVLKRIGGAVVRSSVGDIGSSKDVGDVFAGQIVICLGVVAYGLLVSYRVIPFFYESVMKLLAGGVPGGMDIGFSEFVDVVFLGIFAVFHVWIVIAVPIWIARECRERFRSMQRLALLQEANPELRDLPFYEQMKKVDPD